MISQETTIKHFANLFGQMQEHVHRTAIDKGWWDKAREGGAWYTEMHHAISLALEASRKGKQAQVNEAQACIDAIVALGPMDYDEDTEEIGTIIGLIHSELSEAWEGKESPSEKLPEYTAIEEEFADVIIRIMDYAAYRGLDIGGAIKAKYLYNLNRPYRHGNKAF